MNKKAWDDVDSWERNLFYYPEKFGFEHFASLDAGGGYDFSYFYILRDIDTDKIYYSIDSGCSCPTPFENIWIDHWTEITSESYLGFIEDLNNWEKWNDDRKELGPERVNLIRKVTTHVR